MRWSFVTVRCRCESRAMAASLRRRLDGFVDGLDEQLRHEDFWFAAQMEQIEQKTGVKRVNVALGEFSHVSSGRGVTRVPAGQLTDTLTRGLPTRGLDISRTSQLADWTTRGLADAAKQENYKHAKSPMASASCPLRDLSSTRVV